MKALEEGCVKALAAGAALSCTSCSDGRVSLYVRLPRDAHDSHDSAVAEAKARVGEAAREVFGEDVPLLAEVLQGAELMAPSGIRCLGLQSHGLGSALCIDEVLPGGWADCFGLQKGDQILCFNGRPSSETSLSEVVQMSQAGGLCIFFARKTAS